ncbi:MAG: DUF2007 domain-containing protein [bacterium]|uniref:DUF2007 domain-containing protein n=2 Tax=Bacteria candidate phyla TaxID=1783234 RepID=A0A124G0C0_UNCT6|nr:MAG: hypothetical protein XD76_1251 [candidate division TA06 bacterium 32_111]KUK86996.1 MAG: hypothetical protein XE03_1085 [candidate division TA06 bacterium 34_109]MDI6701272.1 DUF2007 domain-containing protein [bacterium]HAF06814.1 hypothetical protein [candidate division WOR-3 bacterium]HCP17013.1 hypothetical protein [candidate division WOR-3 bacterium]
MDTDLKLLLDFDDKMEAMIVKSLLESNGIKVYLSSDDAYGYYPSLDLENRVKIFVLEKDYETAKNIVSKGYEKEE